MQILTAAEVIHAFLIPCFSCNVVDDLDWGLLHLCAHSIHENCDRACRFFRGFVSRRCRFFAARWLEERHDTANSSVSFFSHLAIWCNRRCKNFNYNSIYHFTFWASSVRFAQIEKLQTFIVVQKPNRCLFITKIWIIKPTSSARLIFGALT